MRKSVLILGMCACVVGYRGEGEFRGSASLTGITGLRIDVPDTPIPVVACAPMGPDEDQCGFNLVYEGVWHSIGGTSSTAKDNVLAVGFPEELEQLGNFAVLRPDIPAELAGLVELELTSVRLPADRALELRTGTGDIDVSGIEGALEVDIEVGDVSVNCAPKAELCGDGGVAINTGLGRVKVYTRGNADVETGAGSVELYQYGQAERDAYIRSGGGDVVVELAADSNLDLELRGGDIVVSTDTIDTVTHGSFSREVGNGTHRVEIRAGHGDVVVRRFGN